MYQLPDSLLIGSERFTVTYSPKLYKERSVFSSGRGNFSIIEVESRLPIPIIKDELFSQIFHQIVSATCINIDRDYISNTEESCFASILFSVIQDNPFLVRLETLDEVSSVRITGIDWPVRLTDEVQEHNGVLNPCELYIGVDRAIPPKQQVDVLWHEIVHRLDQIIGMGLQERDVKLFAFFISLVFWQNDMLWLIASEGEIEPVREHQGRHDQASDIEPQPAANV